MREQEHLTAAQRAALEAELAELEGPKRAEIVQAIKTAREFGDLSENFEYHAAKNEQGLLERRIHILQERLRNAVVVEGAKAGRVSVGSVVEIEDEHGDRMQLEVSSLGGTGVVSPDSPLGRALMGAREGDTVDVEAPRGAWRARIVAVRAA
jgi:transcription elongation factor GreA